MSIFHLKQFSVQQDQCAMKVSTDAVLLGAWARHQDGQAILDIGTGTGILALIAAQRNPLSAVIGVEIDPAAAQQAQQNAANSPFADRLQIIAQDALQFAQQPEQQAAFHSIISNPPYYDEHKFLSADEPSRQLARSSQSLSYRQLLQASSAMLAPQGRLSLILPISARADFFREAIQAGFYLSRQTQVAYLDRKAPSRLLLELSKSLQTPLFAQLCVQEGTPPAYSAEFSALCADLYPFL